MKVEFILAVVLALSSLTACAEVSDWQKDYDTLLKKYVGGGGVRYAGWKANGADVAALGKVVEAIGAANTSGLSRNDQIAFYTNAYNAWILHEALEKYPTKSVKDPLFTFFTGKRITVAGERMSFKHLEDEIIRPRFKEPRVHFALNCASRSCPPLRAEAYDGAKLDAQFDEQTRAFVNSDRGVKPSAETGQLSKIFDWYKADFGGEAGVMAFLRKYRKGTSEFKSVTYQDYDWGLNETK
jgi:hypothetical protein